MANENVNFEVFWDDIRVAPYRRPVQDVSLRSEPGDMVIGTSIDRILVTIKSNGTLEFGPEYKPDEAAMIFWEAMGQKRLEMEDRLLLIGHMEAILTRLGEADLRAESARRTAINDPTNMELERVAVEAVRRLERIMSQTIELGRGLIRRPEVPMPAFPSEVPRSIRAVEHSAYEGHEGVDEEDP